MQWRKGCAEAVAGGGNELIKKVKGKSRAEGKSNIEAFNFSVIRNETKLFHNLILIFLVEKLHEAWSLSNSFFLLRSCAFFWCSWNLCWQQWLVGLWCFPFRASLRVSLGFGFCFSVFGIDSCLSVATTFCSSVFGFLAATLLSGSLIF